jgi:hypothetical protein
MNRKSILATWLAALLGVNSQAQPVVEMADTMRQQGKIYVVVAVMATVFAGLALYLWRLDRRVSKMEKKG